jgi:hypothetical protein
VLCRQREDSNLNPYFSLRTKPPFPVRTPRELKSGGRRQQWRVIDHRPLIPDQFRVEVGGDNVGINNGIDTAAVN